MPPEDRVTWSTLPRAVQLIQVAFILANLGGAMFYDQLAVYLTEELDAGVPEVGTFFVFAAVMGALTRILGGWVSDAIGHFRGIGIGSILGLTGAVLLWWAPTWPIAMACYTFNLAGMSMVGPSATAAITDLTPAHLRSRTFGLTSSVFQIVGILGPLIGGLVIENFGWRGVLALNAGLMACATLVRVGLSGYETAVWKRPRWRGLARDLKWIYAGVLAGSVFGIVQLIDIGTDSMGALSMNLRSLFLEDVRELGPTERGVLFTIGGVAAMPAMLLGGWLGDRIGELKTMAIGLLFGAAGYLLFPFATTLPLAGLSFALMGAMGGFFEPTFRALISKVVPRERLATAYGSILGATNLISFPAAKLGPVLYDQIDPTLPFLVSGIGTLVVAGVLLLLMPRLERKLKAEKMAAPAAA